MDRFESPIEAEIRERLRPGAPHAEDRLGAERRAVLHRTLARRAEARRRPARWLRPAVVGALLLAAASFYPAFFSARETPPGPGKTTVEPGGWPTARSIDVRLERLETSLAGRRTPAGTIFPSPSLGAELSRLRESADRLRQRINQG